MSMYGDSNWHKNDLNDDIGNFFENGGSIEELFEVMHGAFKFGKTPIDKLQEEKIQLQNNWNELKKFVEAKVKHWEDEEKKWIELGFMKFGGEANNKLIFKIVLNKMQELEGNNE